MNTFMSHYVQKLLFLITNLASSALNIVIYIMVPKYVYVNTHYLFPKFLFITSHLKNKY